MDLIIRNTQIFDGSGGQATHGDVAVKAGIIVAIGGNLNVTGAEEVDAGGRPDDDEKEGDAPDDKSAVHERGVAGPEPSGDSVSPSDPPQPVSSTTAVTTASRGTTLPIRSN